MKMKKKAIISVKQQIVQLLDLAHEELKPIDKANVGEDLYDIFFWQEICSVSNGRLKHVWREAQVTGPIEDDDAMRKRGKGEHLIVESDKFSCLATVKEAPGRFDQQMFIDKLSSMFKLDRDVLEGIAESCYVKGTAPLQKRVVEA